MQRNKPSALAHAYAEGFAEKLCRSVCNLDVHPERSPWPYGAGQNAVNAGRVDIGRLRWPLACLPLPRWPDGADQAGGDREQLAAAGRRDQPGADVLPRARAGQEQRADHPGLPVPFAAALEPGWPHVLDGCCTSRRAGARGHAGRPAAPAGVTCSRILAAWAAVISLARPPGTSSQSTAWSRQATWLRDRPRSRCRLAHTFSTAAWTSLALGVLYGCICGTVVNFILDVGGNTSNLVTRNRRALPPGYLHMAGAKCGRSTDRQANDQTADQIGGSVGVLRRRVYHVA